jgi:hypothetical protein
MSRSVVLALLLSYLFEQSNAFAPTLPFTKYAAATTYTSDRVVAAGIQHVAPSSPVALHMIDPVQSSLLLAEVEPWVQPTVLFLDPFLNLFSFAMVRNVPVDRLVTDYYRQYGMCRVSCFSCTHSLLLRYTIHAVGPRRLELVPQDEREGSAVGFLGGPYRTATESGKGFCATRVWSGHYSRLLASYFYLYPRDSARTAGTLDHEDQVRNIERKYATNGMDLRATVWFWCKIYSNRIM